MDKKTFTEKIIVMASQYYTTEFTRKLYESLKKDNIPFTFLVVFDGTPFEKIESLKDIVDIGIILKQGVHSLPELWNCGFNLAKASDAEFLMICGNDTEFKKGSFRSMVSLVEKYDMISPVKIDHDRERFESYFSEEEPVEVIGCNDSAWLIRLAKITYNAIDRKYGPLGFEDVPFIYQLWKDGSRFVVDRKAVVFHHCSKDTPYCFSPEDRKKYSAEWDLKADYFKANNGPSAKWFFDNVLMNVEAIKRFGYPVYIL